LVVKFPPTLKLNTLLVMVDEYYHVYVANDLKMQLEKHYPELKAQFYPSSDAYTALTEVRNQLEEKYQDVFQLIAVSIFETTLVKELTDLFNAKNIHCSIREYINGHINDEAKHHNFFFDLLCFTWQNLDKDFQDVIGGKLVDFLLRYFGVASWREFNYCLLLKLTNDPILSEEIIKDLFDNFEVTPEIPIVRNVIKTLTKAGISDNEFFKKSLTAIGWEL
ncbi:MAG: hypothetical protein EBT45_08530, partial [Alphaproteobacteria bacterium]|nr:hypothetical protein [Alphaproteobacteria bacterium]